MFGQALRMTADAIMKTDTASESNPIITLAQLGVFLFACFFISYLFARRKEKKQAASAAAVPVETVQTEMPEERGERAVKCPNCGAGMKISVNTTGKCAYCGTYIYVNQEGRAEIAKV